MRASLGPRGPVRTRLRDLLARRPRFGADPDIVGRQITLDGASSTIIGVMPRGFRVHFSTEPDLWRPVYVRPSGTTAGGTFVNAVLRTPDSVSAARAPAWRAVRVDPVESLSA